MILGYVFPILDLLSTFWPKRRSQNNYSIPFGRSGAPYSRCFVTSLTLMFNTDLDNRNQRSYKRELELFANEVQDSWEHDDNEYLSRREQQEDYFWHK